MSVHTEGDIASQARPVRIRARALADAGRPVWLSELFEAAAEGAGGDDASCDDVLAALAVMYDHGEIHAVIRAAEGWVPAPAETYELVGHVDRTLQELGRLPVRGEVLVVRAARDAAAHPARPA